jgi:hypothetical protein
VFLTRLIRITEFFFGDQGIKTFLRFEPILKRVARFFAALQVQVVSKLLDLAMPMNARCVV